MTNRSMLTHTALALSLCSIATAADIRWADAGHGVLKDGRTGLQWTQSDNGGDIDWNAARSYCAEKAGGWRLPTVEELTAIYGEAEASRSSASCGGTMCGVSPLFTLTGPWFWSATPVGKEYSDADELAWGVLLVNGVRTQALREVGYGSRALCVRSGR